MLNEYREYRETAQHDLSLIISRQTVTCKKKTNKRRERNDVRREFRTRRIDLYSVLGLSTNEDPHVAHTHRYYSSSLKKKKKSI